MAVGEGEVGRGRHRREVRLPLRRRGRRAGELAVGQHDAVAAPGGVHRADVVGADLVAEAARAGVDEHRHLALRQPEGGGGRLVEDVLDPLQLDAVVLTHAHLDHSGYLPVLASLGWIWVNGPTARPS